MLVAGSTNSSPGSTLSTFLQHVYKKVSLSIIGKEKTAEVPVKKFQLQNILYTTNWCQDYSVVHCTVLVQHL
jgi:hypothetical protein